MVKEVNLTNRSKNRMDILVEPTADLIDFHHETTVSLKFDGDFTKIDLVFLLEEGIVQVFSNQEAEFIDYSITKISD